MNDTKDNAGVLVPPPAAWAAAFLIGLGLDWLHPLPFMPGGVPRVWVGAAVVAIGVALAVSALIAFRRAGTRVEPYKPTTAIVSDGPFGLTRNPIYVGMFLGQIGLAIGFDSLWIVVMLVPFFLVIRYGVVAREEAYLERKFGSAYLDYKSRTRRWV
jgi:protein-S-isoprenylcysteine O-methyltransferase Ste14